MEKTKGRRWNGILNRQHFYIMERLRCLRRLTAVTGATAVTVSESTGNVMVFRGGKAILEVEKIRLGGSPTRGTDLRQE